MKRDQNRRVASMAVTDDANNDIKQLLVDPVTGRLLVTISFSVPGGSVHTYKTSDANYEKVSQATTDNIASVAMPLHTNSNGYLLIDLE